MTTMIDTNNVTGSSSIPGDDIIRGMLIDRIDVRHQAVGMVAGVVDSSRRSIVSWGKLAENDPRIPDADTVFEIGSITKVFTRLLLVDMARHGEVAYDDPVARYLPPTVRVPERNGRSITLFDLAMHTSGLPRVPDNINPFNPENPYANYTAEELYQFLSGYELPRDIGSEHEYSNLGFGLLGHALARRADTDYESLVRSRICDPLGMNDTRITLTPSMKARLAPGHDASSAPIDNWDFGVLAGGGGLRSTANDLLTFLSAYFGFVRSPLEASMAAANVKIQPPVEQANIQTSLGWGILTNHGKEIAYHTGGTGGYRSIAAFDINAAAGVVVLSNMGTDIHDIGLHFLDPETPLIRPPIERIVVPVDTGLFDFYVGTYQLDPEFALVISQENNRLFAKMTGMAKCEIFPESERDFFFKVRDMQITFVPGQDGYATELICSDYGYSAHIKRTG